MPTASSPSVISQPNQPCASLSMRNCRKLRYHSNVIDARAGGSGTLTAFCQKPRRLAPPSTQPVPVSLCQPASIHSKLRKIRIGSQKRPARVLLNR